ncbi:DUF1405 domain-containing protein [Chungangia koreensis]|uniref:DUF1405 domain-containing protein n=1 Tax=Chungangia koreensis TaxID=752657 RepID=A0ABV8X7H4_9LACT
MSFWRQLTILLYNRSFLWLLFFINLGGTIFGYYWYKGQLSVTDPIYYLFVPDSPTASLFFTIAVFGWLLNKNWRLIEAFALITLVKYGLWAVVMNLLTLAETGDIGWEGWMLVGSHFAMALQAVLYIPKYDFSYIHVIIAAIWTLHNDVIDYVFGQMPTYSVLLDFMSEIGYFTFWLSIACILLALYCVKYIGRSKADLSVDQAH